MSQTLCRSRDLQSDPADASPQRLGCCRLTQHRGILNTHVSRTMHELIGARLWLPVYQLPPYAPEFNPVEGVWSHLTSPTRSARRRGGRWFPLSAHRGDRDPGHRAVAP
ncbi:transposase [Streptomyces phaeochromogenes]|uniref:transposase n=1 Tax=Streptomyces phaeochromogenes TaxID=1923 RepID=UPI0036B3DEFB